MAGQRSCTAWASFKPSMVPGIWMSLNRSEMSDRDSRIAMASSALTACTGQKPASSTISTARMRRIISSSTTRTLGNEVGDVDICARHFPGSSDKLGRRFAIVGLAARRHQTSFMNPDIGFTSAQTRCFEVRPDLAQAVPGHRVARQPVRLRQSNGFARFHLRSEAGQHHYGHSEEREHRERDKRFHHGGCFAVDRPVSFGDAVTTTKMKYSSFHTTYI